MIDTISPQIFLSAQSWCGRYKKAQDTWYFRTIYKSLTIPLNSSTDTGQKKIKCIARVLHVFLDPYLQILKKEMSVSNIAIVESSFSIVSGGWSPPNTTYPSGLEYLMGLDYLFVNQKIELLEGELCRSVKNGMFFSWGAH